jgi:hypothetical protein
MPNRAIEIHDSEVESLLIDVGQVVLEFSSAYIHQSDGRPAIDAGIGWTQRAVIRVDGEVATGSLTEYPATCPKGTSH